MNLYGVPEGDLRRIVEQVSREQYEGNLTFNNIGRKGNAVTFTLRVRSSKGPGHRVSASAFSTRRRLVAACWHAHRDVMAALFSEFPRARLKSAIADYRGRDSFEMTFPETAYHNIGSQMYPVQMSDACECDGPVTRAVAVSAVSPSVRALSLASTGQDFSYGDAATWSARDADAEIAAWREILDGAKTNKS